MHEKELAAWLAAYDGPPLRLMEVCGTHTSALYRSGLRQMLPPSITFLSGPGCPVCVTPTSYIDKLASYALTPGHKVLAFGDLLAVPGSRMSLAGARDRGGAVDFFYNPEDALEIAKAHEETTFILAAVGFETTAPIWADLVKRAYEGNISNIKFLTALKTMPRAMEMISREALIKSPSEFLKSPMVQDEEESPANTEVFKGEPDEVLRHWARNSDEKRFNQRFPKDSRIDGFLCPGHVAVITGSRPFKEMADAMGETMVIGGFSPTELLRALARLVLEASRKHKGLWNEYPTVVREEGNTRAKALVEEVFTAGDAVWRGLGAIEGSGLYLSEKYKSLDAGSFGLTEDKMPRGCCCGEVLTGRIQPQECPCFGRACTPEHPVGACMVSSEGACCVTFREGRE